MQTVKHDQNKTDLSLLDNEYIHGIAKVLMFGAKKYERDNWRNGTQWSRTFSACKRHLDAWWDGEDLDPETGLSHLYHASCNLQFLDYWQRNGKGEDNRYITLHKEVNNLSERINKGLKKLYKAEDFEWVDGKFIEKN